MNPVDLAVPLLFKGIALFTPGGSLIYCLDPDKQNRWHLQLCLALQEILNLPEPPHFLVPCYTATIDRWLDPQKQQIQTFAEAYPPVLRYQSLLNAIFQSDGLVWQPAPLTEGLCDPMVLKAYASRFPELWDDLDLVIRFEQVGNYTLLKASEGSRIAPTLQASQQAIPPSDSQGSSGYVLRLFISGHNPATEQTLQLLHQTLDESLHHPYTLKVIDISKHPEQAEANQISATPTLLKVWPLPVRKIVGELTNPRQILHALDSLV